LCVGCDSRTDVDAPSPAQVSDSPSTDDGDDLQAAALSAMFSADIHGDVPSDREYLAVMLLEKQTPDADFLDRFAAQDTEVITHAEGARREPKDRGPQTAGLYFRIESIDWVGRNQATVQIMVGNGWAAAIYRLQLRKTKDGWSCVEIERTAIS
jgi:hypothetical protein